MSRDYKNYGNRGYRGGKRSYKGGGTKDFKADPIKQFLFVRGTSCAYAKDLCVAGKIKLEDIPEWTDRFTVLQYGKLEVDSKVDAEVLRIGTRLIRKVEERRGTFDEFEKQNPVSEDGITPNEPEQEPGPTDGAAEFDIQREREQYEREEAERKAQEDDEVPYGEHK